MGHIELARWADRIVIAPASADIIARLANGMANDLLTTLCLATAAPIAIAPAMNQLDVGQGRDASEHLRRCAIVASMCSVLLPAAKPAANSALDVCSKPINSWLRSSRCMAARDAGMYVCS